MEAKGGVDMSEGILRDARKASAAPEGLRQMREGIRDAVPVMAGYFAVSFALGITMKRAGLTPWQGFWMSLLNNASAGEYAGLAMITAGAPLWELALMTLIANARYLLMSCALSQKLSPKVSVGSRLAIGFDVTDELFGLAVARPGKLDPCYYYGAMLLALPGWALGTMTGVVAGQALPQVLVGALGVALYGMFLAVIIPPCRKSRVLGGLVALSFAASFACSVLPLLKTLSGGTRTILLTVILSALAAWKFPVKEENA
jgi:predicted branched-subunit amino acid permease